MLCPQEWSHLHGCIVGTTGWVSVPAKWPAVTSHLCPSGILVTHSQWVTWLHLSVLQRCEQPTTIPDYGNYSWIVFWIGATLAEKKLFSTNGGTSVSKQWHGTGGDLRVMCRACVWAVTVIEVPTRERTRVRYQNAMACLYGNTRSVRGCA